VTGRGAHFYFFRLPKKHPPHTIIGNRENMAAKENYTKAQ
jgi:hypothetical protein